MDPEDLGFENLDSEDEEEYFVIPVPPPSEDDDEDTELVINIVPPEVGFAILAEEE
jgi:hypothetical protein